MEKNKKDLKIYSILILAFVAFSLIQSIVMACVNGLPQLEEIPSELTKEMVETLTIVVFALGFVVLIPQIYIGIKGLKVANGTTVSGKAHLVWAIILAVVAGLATISGIVGLTKALNVDNVLAVLDPAVDVVLFICYYLCARKIATK